MVGTSETGGSVNVALEAQKMWPLSLSSLPFSVGSVQG